jgi:hypothetical protein
MTNYARVIDGVAIDVCGSPEETFHSDIAVEFIQVPDDVVHGWILTGSTWSAPIPVETPTPAQSYPMLSRMKFYMSFTTAERIAIKASTDDIVKEFWATYQMAVQTGADIDMALKSNRDAVNYLATPTTATPPGPGIIMPDRVADILQGVAQ